MRKEICRLEASGHIVERSHGYYRAFADPGLLALAEKPEPCVHAVQIRAKLPLSGGLGVAGVPRGARQIPLSDASGAVFAGRSVWAADDSNGQAVRLEWVMGRRVEFRASSSGVVLVSVAASRDPIKIADWPEFSAMLRGVSLGVGLDLDAPSAELVNVEFNADWRSWFLGGLSRMRLRSVSRAWAQIYQKHRDALRLELRVAPRELSFKEAAAQIVALTEAPDVVRDVRAGGDLAPAGDVRPFDGVGYQ